MKKYKPKTKKTNKKHGQDVERVFVDTLVEHIESLDSNISCMIDLDSAHRVFKSKYDLQLVRNSRSVFIEAKRTLYSKPENVIFRPSDEDDFLDVWAMLRDEQKIGCSMLNLSGTPYYIVHFKTTKNAGLVLADVFRVTSVFVTSTQARREIKLILFNLNFEDLAHYFFKVVYDA